MRRVLFIFRRMNRALFFLLALAGMVGAAPREIVVCTYNVENYVDTKPAGNGSAFGVREKSEAAVAALVHIIGEVNADILGVCEMGPPARFEDFKKRINAAGLGYIDSEYVQASDAERHLALVSRYPIVARDSVADVSFELNGQLQRVRRGFLDVTIEINPGYRLRLVGAHLKSKLPAPEGEALLRRYEAQALRRHLDRILAADSAVNLVCYGDFNDLKNEPAFAEISGARGAPNHMTDLCATDSAGERWTQYWKTADLYSRIDYLLVSRALLPEIAKNKAGIYRGVDWNVAGDHRPVFASILPVNRK